MFSAHHRLNAIFLILQINFTQMSSLYEIKWTIQLNKIDLCE